jgi:uncharacterized protein
VRLPLLSLIALLAACAAEVSGPAQEPSLELTGRVVDAANVLSEGYEQEMTDRLAQLETETRVQLVVATTPSLRGASIESYSLNLANGWGIGSEERDDGLLLLVAPNDRRVRIEVGRGLEASVKDEEAADIIENAIIPSFEKSDYEEGISNGVGRLIEEVSPVQLKEAA